MEHYLIYNDESLHTILEVHSKKMSDKKLKETIIHYRQYGFNGEFTQERVE